MSGPKMVMDSEIEKKWIRPVLNWGFIFNQFITIFENRILL
jgi:hypothetical protein